MADRDTIFRAGEEISQAIKAGEITSREQVLAMLQERGVTPDELRAFQPTLGDKIRGVAEQYGFGANTKLVELYELPLEAGRELFAPLSESLGLPAAVPEREKRGPLREFLAAGEKKPPVTPGQAIARRAGEFVVEDLPLAAAPFAATAGQVQPVVRAGQSALQAGVARMGEAARQAPARAAASELAASLGAGTGAGIAEQAAPGNALAETGGALAGGAVAAAAPIATGIIPSVMIGRLVREGIARATGKSGSMARRAREYVEDQIGRALGPEEQQALDSALAAREQIGPEFNPTLAEATGSPALTRTQQQIEAEMSGVELEARAAARLGTGAAVERFEEAQRPAGVTQDLLIAADQRVRGIQDKLRLRHEQNVRQQESLAQMLPESLRSETGEKIRSRLLDLRQIKKDEMSDLADELALNDVDLTADFGRFAKTLVESVKNTQGIFTDPKIKPDVIRQIKKFVPKKGKKPSEPITFQDYLDLRSRITDDLRAARRSTEETAAKKIRQLAILLKGVDEGFNVLWANQNPQIVANAQAFRKTYFNDYIKVFERGAADKVRTLDASGRYRTADEDVARAFMQRAEDIRQFRTIFANDIEARGAFESTFLDMTRQATVKNGTIDSNAMRQWLNKPQTREILDAYPEFREQLSTIQGTADWLRGRQLVLEDRQRRVERAALSKTLQKVDGNFDETGLLMSNALKNRKLWTQIVNSTRDNPEARAGLQRAVWDMAGGTATERRAFLEANREQIREALDPEHVRALDVILSAHEVLERAPALSGRAIRPEPMQAIEEQIGTGMPQLGTRIWAFWSRRVPQQYLITELTGRVIRGQSILENKRLMKEALYNPQVASDYAEVLLSRQIKPVVARRLNTWLMTIGWTAGDEDTERAAAQPEPEMVQ